MSAIVMIAASIIVVRTLWPVYHPPQAVSPPTRLPGNPRGT